MRRFYNTALFTMFCTGAINSTSFLALVKESIPYDFTLMLDYDYLEPGFLQVICAGSVALSDWYSMYCIELV